VTFSEIRKFPSSEFQPHSSRYGDRQWIGALLPTISEDKLKEISEKVWMLLSLQLPPQFRSALENSLRFPGLRDLTIDCQLGADSQLIRGRYFEFSLDDIFKPGASIELCKYKPGIQWFRVQLELDFEWMRQASEIAFLITELNKEGPSSKHLISV
jgi:hypothetical protein